MNITEEEYFKSIDGIFSILNVTSRKISELEDNLKTSRELRQKSDEHYQEDIKRLAERIRILQQQLDTYATDCKTKEG